MRICHRQINYSKVTASKIGSSFGNRHRNIIQNVIKLFKPLKQFTNSNRSTEWSMDHSYHVMVMTAAIVKEIE